MTDSLPKLRADLAEALSLQSYAADTYARTETYGDRQRMHVANNRVHEAQVALEKGERYINVLEAKLAVADLRRQGQVNDQDPSVPPDIRDAEAEREYQAVVAEYRAFIGEEVSA